MRIGYFHVDTSLDSPLSKWDKLFELDSDTGVVVKIDDKGNSYPLDDREVIYRSSDFQHRNPIHPSEGTRYLEALLEDQRSSYSYFKKLK